jgi:Ca2+:H+ antiporter
MLGQFVHCIQVCERVVAIRPCCNCLGKQIMSGLLGSIMLTPLCQHFARPQEHLWIFILSYIAMVPAANLVGFGGQELARKLPTVLGVVLETTLGSLVEMILFVVLLVKNRDEGVAIVQAAILGSILANLLLCMGLCFFFGGLRRHEQTFHDAVSDTGSNLMLVAGFALVIPVTYANALSGRENLPLDQLKMEVVKISRATAIVLLLAFAVYTFFQMKSHHSIYDDILEEDEQNDADRHRDLAKAKLTLTESIVALALAITFVSMMAVFLVENIDFMRDERGLSDSFLGTYTRVQIPRAKAHQMAIRDAQLLPIALQSAVISSRKVDCPSIGSNTISIDSTLCRDR